MDYAMKSLSLLTPTSLSKAVTSSVSVSTSMAHQLFSHVPRPKPFRVTNADRSVKKGMMADGLMDLLNKVRWVSESLSSDGIILLVLEEDGTGVDTEEFFQTLPENTVLMFLEKGQKWTPSSVKHLQISFCPCTEIRKDVAKLTFDLYKNNPKDFIGCLSVKATLYGAYSVSYDLRCYAAKKVLKEALRWTLFSMQATGHILLGSSCYIEQLLEEEEQAQKITKCLKQLKKMVYLS
uniref:Cell death inducing DFFA like effector c n=1 Tax=Oryzias sinensis TaxID=183150 RepID=A0A8C7WW69_9TELE